MRNRLGNLLTVYKDSVTRAKSPFIHYPQQGAPYSITRPILKVEETEFRKKKEVAVDQLTKWLKKTHPQILREAVAATEKSRKLPSLSGYRGLGETEDKGWFDSLLENISKITTLKSTVELNKSTTELERARTEAQIRELQTNINRASNAQPPVNYPASSAMPDIKIPLIITGVILALKKVF